LGGGLELEYQHVKGTDIEVSRIGLGTWSIGGSMSGGSDERQSVRTILSAIDNGINLIDTAPVYGFGRAEEIVGKALHSTQRRQELVIATKVGLDWSNGRAFRNATAARIISELEDSLRRLQTDYIDIYQVHWPDSSVPFEETATAMEKLYKEGKIRAIGVSNFSPEEIYEFVRYAPLHTVQPPYNIFERDVEDHVLPYCVKMNVSVLAYGAICRGLLGGGITAQTRFENGDLRSQDPKFQSPRLEQYTTAVRRLDAFAQAEFGKSVLELSLRWLLDRPGVTSALWGVRTPEQLAPLTNVLDWKIDTEAMEIIDGVVRTYVPEPIGAHFMAPPTRIPTPTTQIP
jgi:aryl-alcohol dehydrogenase-like predicted oxidoreductase